MPTMIAPILSFMIVASLTLSTLPTPCSSFSRPSPSGTRTRANALLRGTHILYHRRSITATYPINALPSQFSFHSSRISTTAIGMSTKPNEKAAESASNSMDKSKSQTGQPPSIENQQLQQQAINNFISILQTSLEDESFVSFNLKGPSAPRRKKRITSKSNTIVDEQQQLQHQQLLEKQKEKLRGKFKLISGRLVLLRDGKNNNKKKKKKTTKSSLDENDTNDGTLYLQATIKYHLATDVAQNWKVNAKQSSMGNNENNGKPTNDEVGEGLRGIFSSAMSTTTDDYQEGNDTNKNNGAPLSEWGAIQNTNGELGILEGELVTTNGVYVLRLHPPQKASCKLSKNKSSQNKLLSQSQANDSSQLSHDKPKNVPLSPSSAFFQRLGVSTPDGKPLIGMASKLRQCQRFVEIVGNLVEPNAVSQSHPSTIRVIDMGCGRGYLTFSLHSYLCNKFSSQSMGQHQKRVEDESQAQPLQFDVQTQGIDRRPKLIQEINAIAHDLGGDFLKLNFIEGNIGNTGDSLFEDNTKTMNTDSNTKQTLDILIALHACDTATDDALWFAIQNDADIIVTAPCCHHELRPQIDHHTTNHPDHSLSDVLRHAIYRERSTEIVTDAMRAILLEIAGYTTQVFEFVGGEHTSKNVMITATKMKRELDKEKWLAEKRRRLVELAQLYGVKRQKLAMMMGESIGSVDEEGKNRAVKKIGMPPL